MVDPTRIKKIVEQNEHDQLVEGTDGDYVIFEDTRGYLYVEALTAEGANAFGLSNYNEISFAEEYGDNLDAENETVGPTFIYNKQSRAPEYRVDWTNISTDGSSDEYFFYKNENGQWKEIDPKKFPKKFRGVMEYLGADAEDFFSTPEEREKAHQKYKKRASNPENILKKIKEQGNVTRNPDGSFSTDGKVYLLGFEGELPIKFKYVAGDFNAAKVTSLNGFPEEVGGTLSLMSPYLKDLKGAPKKVGELFISVVCTSLPKFLQNTDYSSKEYQQLRKKHPELF